MSASPRKNTKNRRLHVTLVAALSLASVLLVLSHAILSSDEVRITPEMKKVVLSATDAAEIVKSSAQRISGSVALALETSVIRRKDEWEEEKRKSLYDNSIHPKFAEGETDEHYSSVPPNHPWYNLTVRTDTLPGGCRHGFANLSGMVALSCGFEIHSLLDKNVSSIEEAAKVVAKQYPEACGRCVPNKDNKPEFPYFRYDQVAPPILGAATHFLQSVPNEWRVPESGFGDLAGYLRKSAEETPDRRYLCDFNPSIIVLPPHHRPHISDPEDQPTYLASYRVSSWHSYVGRVLRKYLAKAEDEPPRDLLGLAFLRSDLSIIQDVVVSLRQLRTIMEDPRLFLLNDTVYVGTNDRLIALHVETEDEFPSNRSFPYQLENVFASPLVATVLQKYRTCAINAEQAKNINYFTDEDNVTVLAEMWPSHPHEVVPIRNLDKMEPQCKNVQANVERDVIVDSNDPQPSFSTLEELNFPKMRPRFPLLTPRPRGTACCVSLIHEGRRLLVGVSHDKTPYSRRRANIAAFHPNHFLSQFYAFEPRTPYSVVALSGYFCLGLPSPELDGPPVNSDLIDSTKWDSLWLKERFDCPKIHFVSGMAEAADDPGMVILAYGVNDFLGRFVKVSKRDIASLLFDRDLKKIRGFGTT